MLHAPTIPACVLFRGSLHMGDLLHPYGGTTYNLEGPLGINSERDSTLHIFGPSVNTANYFANTDNCMP